MFQNSHDKTCKLRQWCDKVLMRRESGDLQSHGKIYPKSERNALQSPVTCQECERECISWHQKTCG